MLSTSVGFLEGVFAGESFAAESFAAVRALERVARAGAASTPSVATVAAAAFFLGGIASGVKEDLANVYDGEEE